MHIYISLCIYMHFQCLATGRLTPTNVHSSTFRMMRKETLTMRRTFQSYLLSSCRAYFIRNVESEEHLTIANFDFRWCILCILVLPVHGCPDM